MFIFLLYDFIEYVYMGVGIGVLFIEKGLRERGQKILFFFLMMCYKVLSL